MKYVLPKDAAELTKLIKSAVRSAKSMRDRVQIAAVAILHHAMKHGDWTKANDLVLGLGHGVKRDSLIEYFVVNGGLTVGEGKEGFIGWKGKEFIEDHFNDAKDNKWWDYKKTNPFQGWDVNAQVQTLAKKYRAMVKATEDMDEADKEKVVLDLKDEVLQNFLIMFNLEAQIVEEEEQEGK